MFLSAVMLLVPSCSREGNSAQPARGGSADPGDGTMSGASAPAVPGPAMTFQLPPVTSLSEIFSATNVEALSTRTVQLTGATVQQVFPDGHFMAIGPDSEHTLMVQFSGLHPEIKAGQKVDVMGIIDPLGKDKSQWNVSPAEQQVLDRHNVFVREVTIRQAQ